LPDLIEALMWNGMSRGQCGAVRSSFRARRTRGPVPGWRWAGDGASGSRRSARSGARTNGL